MDFSKLPTDNLYKFIAIFALIVLIATFYYNITLLNDIRLLQSDVNVESNNLIMELRQQFEKDSLIKFLAYNAKIDNKDYYRKLLAESEIRLNTLHEKQLQIKKKKSLADIKWNSLENYSSSINITQYIALFWMISGFLLWYFKLQRYQDIIIKYEAMKIKAEPEKNS